MYSFFVNFGRLDAFKVSALRRVGHKAAIPSLVLTNLYKNQFQEMLPQFNFILFF